jgi:hypothetical protein
VGRFASLARDGFGEEVGGIKRAGIEGGGGGLGFVTPLIFDVAFTL